MKTGVTDSRRVRRHLACSSHGSQSRCAPPESDYLVGWNGRRDSYSERLCPFTLFLSVDFDPRHRFRRRSARQTLMRSFRIAEGRGGEATSCITEPDRSGRLGKEFPRRQSIPDGRGLGGLEAGQAGHSTPLIERLPCQMSSKDSARTPRGRRNVREGEEQVDRQEEQIAHESNVITPANLRKATRQGPFGLEFKNSPPTGCEAEERLCSNMAVHSPFTRTTRHDDDRTGRARR
jgi:hypothetical protein